MPRRRARDNGVPPLGRAGGRRSRTTEPFNRRKLPLLGVLTLLVGILAASSTATGQVPPGFTESEFFASDAEDSELFGFAIDIDADTAVVGAPGGAGTGKPGAAYVFAFDGTTWVEQTILAAATPVAGESFGYDVSIDGDTIVVGARNVGGAGGAYVFNGSGATWTEDTRLDGGGGGTVDDQFGTSVDVDGDRILVGAPLDDTFGLNAGAAHLFEDSGGWANTLSVSSPSSPAANGLFGDAVLIAGSRLVVGAPIETVGGLGLAGSAYIFDAATGALDQTLEPTDRQAFHGYGTSFSLDGGVLAVGANGDVGPAGFDPTCDTGTGACNPGAVYLYDDSPGGFIFTSELFATDLETAPNFSPGAQFGIETALVDGTLLVGARNNDSSNTNTGRAHVFTLDDGTWIAGPVITVSDVRQGDLAGSAVAIHDGSTFAYLVGVPLDDSANGLGTNNEGAFYTFTPPVSCNGETATIVGTPDDDVLLGTAGDDVIVGLGGRDIIKGLDGDDIICGNAGADQLDGGGGDDVILGGGGGDQLAGRSGADELRGKGGDDQLTGGSGPDDLHGGQGDDQLRGGGGADALNGGADVDQCDSGGGAGSETACE